MELPQGERRLCATFFIPRSDSECSAREFAEKAGFVDLFVSDSHPEPLHGTWGGMADCYVTLKTWSHHHQFSIYFWLSDFMELKTGEEGDPIEAAFCAACEELSPEVGILVTHLDQANPEYLADVYTDVLGMSATILVNRGFGLLYLNQDFQQDLTSSARTGGRDKVDLASGFAIYAGHGRDRWF